MVRVRVVEGIIVFYSFFITCTGEILFQVKTKHCIYCKVQSLIHLVTVLHTVTKLI